MQRALAVLVFSFFAIGCGESVPPVGEVSGALSDVACDQNGCISVSAFSAAIKKKLDGTVVGYAARVGAQNAVVGGLARTKTDSPPSGIAMSTSRQIQVASISKVITTVAVIHALDAHNISLNQSISSYLWPQWTKGSNIEKITFKNLLTHMSGFRQDCGGANTSYSQLQAQVLAGVNVSDMSSASYNNCNFAIFRELLPFIEGQKYTGAANDSDRAAWSASFYTSYVNQHVFAPLGLGTRQCQGSPSSDVLSYSNPAGTTAGDDWPEYTSETCGGGGWYLSLDDLYAFANDLASGSNMLTPTEKATMVSSALGWDNSVRSDCPNPNVCKNGGMENGAIALSTYVGVFKCSVPVVAVVNSALPPAYSANGAITNLIADAMADPSVKAAGTPICCNGNPPCGGGVNHLGGACCGDGQTCNASGQCVNQCKAPGSSCSANGDCCWNGCVNGTCSCQAQGQPCGATTICCGSYTCSRGVCVVPNITTCNGRPKPTPPCTGGWRCCGDDGWHCGNCI